MEKKKQTRRSVSIRGTTYDRLRDHCAKTGLSMSDFVEQLLAEFFAGTKTAQKGKLPEPVMSATLGPSGGRVTRDSRFVF